MYRPVQRCIGQYSFDSTSFKAIEIEAIAVATNTLSYEDYIECRRLYLTTGLFYNDRIFGEIHALLRLLNLTTWEWIKQVHSNTEFFDKDIQMIYSGFIRETQDELWESREELLKDVSGNIKKYLSGKLGGNLIYKYRSKAIVEHFTKLHEIAFHYLREVLEKNNLKHEKLINDLENYSFQQKSNLFDVNVEVVQDYSYDINLMIKDANFARKAAPNDIHYPTKIRFTHSREQKETIQRHIDFYGSSNRALTMIISRFPIKRFYRSAEVLQS